MSDFEKQEFKCEIVGEDKNGIILATTDKRGTMVSAQSIKRTIFEVIGPEWE